MKDIQSLTIHSHFMQDTHDQLSDNKESTTPPVWFNKELCLVCSAGITTRMQELIESGMSERKASRIMSEETQGDVSANLIRKQYCYRTKPRKKSNAKLGQVAHPQDVINEDTDHAGLGQLAHLQEAINEDAQGFVIPLHVDQTALIEALADFMIDKQIPVKAIESTVERAIALHNARISLSRQKDFKWDDLQRHLES